MNNKKVIKNTRKLIYKNKEKIERLILSQQFLELLENNKQFLTPEDIFYKYDEDELEEWYIFGVPTVLSSTIKVGAILEMFSGEFIILQ